MAKFTVVDLETTGNAPAKGDRIIEIGLMVWEDGEVTHEFSSLIYPEVFIPAFISNLTGITEEAVVNAPLFSEIAEDVHSFFQDAYIVAHNIQFDLRFLNHEFHACGLKALRNPVIDTVELSRILFPQANSFKLGHLAEQLDIKHDEPHRALSDTKVTLSLLEKLLNKFTELPLHTLQQLRTLEHNLKSDLDGLLNDEIHRKFYGGELSKGIDIIHGLAVKAPVQPASEPNVPSKSFGSYLDRLFGTKNGLASVVPGYEFREGQRVMSESVYDAFNANHHAMIEAETGTGKSLAYLIPSAYFAVKNKAKVVISTFTTQLQRQLLEKEIPQVERLFDFPLKTAILKGKEHYISTLRFSKEMEERSLDNYDIVLSKGMLLVWLTETVTGDIDEIQLPPSGKVLWNRISTDQEDIEETWSSANRASFYRRARESAENAHIIITNHSLLCTDLTLEHAFLPDYDYIVVDEAHHLDSTASRYFGLQMDYIQWQNFFTQLESFYAAKEKVWPEKLISEIKRCDPILQEMKEELDGLFRYLFHVVISYNKNNVDKNDIGRVQFTFRHDYMKNKQISTIREMFFRLKSRINKMVRTMEIFNAQFLIETNAADRNMLESDHKELTNHMEKLESMKNEMEDYLLNDDDSEVKWLEIDANGAHNAVYLYSEPIDISENLRQSLFNQKKSVVLTSATLTMKHSFKYITDRLGVTGEDLLKTKIPSPYPFDQQVQLMVPNDFPDIKTNQEDFISATCEAIYSLAHITDGRMLVLFTSYDMLKKSYDLLKEIILPEEFMLFAQGISSGSRERLKKNFQAFDQSILLGTSSFWEGVDIPGQDLSCLVIVRLPFQPPNHPVYQARTHYMKRNGKNAFMEQALPPAVIRFKQGFGRLIRSSTDRGIVFVCDQRLINARYGKYFIESIPEVPITVDSTTNLMQKAQEWL
ncbi:ATP-dependent DNA helicase DinG [Thalassobacillus pellis]|uniref:ATP-dependent DNA helicase DinG n=1 Tax=Thalassobacillus pellis TaxID=748008 RepID=UPI001960F264|nr:ATP-dependent DNA helicase DinG [Thalassobacillus pellis]MBM7552492.1 ATP-dependent DNA helicase DinG [Thalassobacillus pellis]